MSKTIELTQGYVAIVDDEDYERVSKYKWCVSSDGYTHNGTVGLMHRFIMGIDDPNLVVDHINHDTLDNRKKNLRVCTNQQNNFNSKPYNKIGYKGVTNKAKSDKRYRKKTYQARITKDGIKYHLGYYSTPEQAAAAYNGAARILFGEFAYLNPLPDHEGD